MSLMKSMPIKMSTGKESLSSCGKLKAGNFCPASFQSVILMGLIISFSNGSTTRTLCLSTSGLYFSTSALCSVLRLVDYSCIS